MIDFVSINEELDPLTDMEFGSAQAAWEPVALILESHHIEVPDVDKFDNEMLFKLKLWDDEGDKMEEHPDLFLYVCLDHNEDETVYHIYTTICDQKDLDLMQHVDDGDDDDTVDE